MAVINDLIDRISDPELRRRINDEVVRLQQQKKFGLVFEEHLPEATPLYDVPINVKSLVARKDGYFKEFFRVKRIEGNVLFCEREDDSHEQVELQKNEAVAVALFGEPIYPYLKPMDAVKNAPDSDLWHTLIEADNYHALQLLVYLYGGMVDCIYIDPPYNTGAKDWKYNNDYVESTDSYRHSKWLSMIKKRLLLAKQLLNPNDSVLIVTIDEKEYLRLGCLLEELFPEADIQMITSVIMPSGSSRTGRFGRADEYIFFCFIGESKVTPWKTDMLRDAPESNVPVRWNGLIRNGEGSRRSRIPSLFYPILLDKNTGKLVSIEDPIPPTMMVEEYLVPEGLVAMWPIDKAGNELMWRLYPPTLREYFRLGYAKLGKRDKKSGYRPISYLQSGMIDKIKAGQIRIIGKDKEGALELEYVEGGKSYAPLTVWNRVSHSAAEHGSGILKKILLKRHFPFPKSVYAVEDSLRFVVANKPNALIVDFFAGSGTTLQAVNLLNAEDGGHRRCIMVTNNEVSEAEAKSLRKQGYQPGDEEWEKYGIARYVNWPRTVCSIEGHDINGHLLKGNYLGIDIPMQDGFKANAKFFKLGFLDKNSVAAYRQFRELLSLLWMKAGAIGECPTLKGKEIPEYLILTENKMAILTEEWAYAKFMDEMKDRQDIKTVFLVVDSEIGFREMAAPLKWAKTYQLYKDYLENFTINYEK
ncbi:adenine-specific DNA-methyltransferase [Prevotella communis]|uniref:site-specific DNA-methyltransferase (adenine-specific) n=1 Tax=Prevotella communis TaxID=2913614 RepID=A0A1H0DW06_9BACT|nr:DNA methyltransferase [Prevotella communis]SDN74342.1 adenine-specific DNA-methyltransferase [Prevotella communis]